MSGNNELRWPAAAGIALAIAAAAAILLAIGALDPAHADGWTDGSGGKTTAALQECLNVSNVAVPLDPAVCKKNAPVADSVTETNTGNTATSASSIDSKMTTSNTNTGNTATSAAATAASTATTATNTGNTATALGTPADAAYGGSGSGSGIALWKWLGALLGTSNTNTGNTASSAASIATSTATIATNTAGASTAANQTNIQANPGSDASKAVAVQGCTSCKSVSVAEGQSSTDGSGTIATGGTAQALFGGTTPSNGFKVAIPVSLGSLNSFVCFVSDTTVTPSSSTAGSYPIYAGGQWSTEPGEKPASAVYLNCPNTGTVFAAKRW